MRRQTANHTNLQLTIKIRDEMPVRERVRNQESAPTWLTRKNLEEKGRRLALKSKRQSSVFGLFADLLGDR